MSESSCYDESRPFDVASRLLVAAAMTALAVVAQRWAVGGSTTPEGVSPVVIAGIAGISAILANANLPLLVRVAVHLGALWALRETLGQDWSVAAKSAVFFAGTAAFLGALAIASLPDRRHSPASPDRPSRRLTTGDLLSALFAFSAYVAIGRNEAAGLGTETLSTVRTVLVNALLPYAVLALAERAIGRSGAAVALFAAAVVATFVHPLLEPIDPFAIALIVAIRTVSRPYFAKTEVQPTTDRRSLA